METLQSEIQRSIQQLFGREIDVRLDRPEAQFGDYATNIAMQLAKPLGRNPREIAEEIAASLRENEQISEVSVAGPGFINIRLTDAALLEVARTEPSQLLAGKKILVEYSDPNPLKPLHAGHLYTTLIGDMIARLVEQAGAETIRLNFGGDVGLHTARSMWAIVEHFGGEAAALHEIMKMEQSDLHARAAFLGERYAAGTEAYETDDAAKQQIVAYNKQVYAVHEEDDHDSDFAKLYWTVRGWSYEYFQVLYDELQVHAFDRFIPESEVTPLGVETVRAHIGDVYEKSTESDAIVFDGEKYGLHTRVFINSEGIPTYEAKDVGLSLTKWRDYQFDQSVIITANEQEQYMQVVIRSIEQFAPEPAQRTRHITHGVVKLQGGVKMSSRRGNVLLALDILSAARAAVQEYQPGAGEETMLAAVKYALARVRIGGDIIYDPKESVALEGNSGPYLQYAHARACSILSKAGPVVELGEVAFDDTERRLVRKLSEYAETVDHATLELMPHYICTYLYELAQEFNRFYEKSRIIGDEREQIRLGLVVLYRDTLARGLGLLGITAPETM